MRNIYLLLIVFFVGCYDSIVVDDAREYCIEYHIGNSWSSGVVTMDANGIHCNGYNLSIQQTPNGGWLLSRTLSSGQVVSETNFFFGAAQSLSDTVRGVCITHILGPVAECESRDTLPVFFIVKKCRGYPDNNGR